MSKEKQIEEMANDLYNNPYKDLLPEDAEGIAKELYNAGYRKQSEGEWISVEPEIGLFACSLCDHRILRAKCNYCPNCGAKMKGGSDGES